MTEQEAKEFMSKPLPERFHQFMLREICDESGYQDLGAGMNITTCQSCKTSRTNFQLSSLRTSTIYYARKNTTSTKRNLLTHLNNKLIKDKALCLQVHP